MQDFNFLIDIYIVVIEIYIETTNVCGASFASNNETITRLYGSHLTPEKYTLGLPNLAKILTSWTWQKVLEQD